MQTLTPARLSRLLLNVALTRPVFIWGPPGIGKSALVEGFAADVGLPCVSLLGSQLAPEDLIGVPRIEGEVSVFCPPRSIARTAPYVLFIDELNACSFEVQKAFYSLLQERKLGEYRMPEGSVVVAAGNRAQDQAIVKPMSSALMNRMLHVELRPSASEWLRWAAGAGLHPWVMAYIETRPDHLHVAPPAGEVPFSTPRSWHLLSDALLAYGDEVTPDEIALLASGCLSPAHALSFGAFVRQLRGQVRIESLLDGSQPLPRSPDDRDVLYFLVQSIRARLVRELPPQRDAVAAHHRQLTVQVKRVLVELCEFNPEMAGVLVAEEGGAEARNLPPWFLLEVVRDLPRLAARNAGKNLMKRSGKQTSNAVREAVEQARARLRSTLLGEVLQEVRVELVEPSEGMPLFGVVDRERIRLSPRSALQAEHWMYVLAHLGLHLAFGHEPTHDESARWLVQARELLIDGFLHHAKIGLPPPGYEPDTTYVGLREEEIAQKLAAQPRDRLAPLVTMAGLGRHDLAVGAVGRSYATPPDFGALLTKGLRRAVMGAVSDAAEQRGVPRGAFAPAEEARRWLMQSIPLLGSLAAEVKIVADADVCRALRVAVAAVDGERGEILVNPSVPLSGDEWRFVITHEVLHLALRHHARCQGRDPHLWNLACDFVVNGWLRDMGVGQMPPLGAIFDPVLCGMSAETAYDLLARDLRRARGLRGLRGELGDMLLDRPTRLGACDAMALDAMVQRCLQAGMACMGRGLEPLGLVEEIRSLFTPPVPWDVELGRWLDRLVPFPREPRRSYARASRRQGATPDIVRPGRHVPEAWLEASTFGVVLDTSGSMDAALLGRALGAIASYAEARGVPAVRLVGCDAVPYDHGFLTPPQLRGAVSVRGRGGTQLQPAITYACNLTALPPRSPLMILTDGHCEAEFHVPRPHCFVLPRPWSRGEHRNVELRTTAPVFRVLKDG